MINTDNYEGHTDDFIWTWKQYASHLDPSNHADRALIQDAPLLLAEVKRLREELAEVEYRLEMAEDVLGRSDWNTIYREIIDEVIE